MIGLILFAVGGLGTWLFLSSRDRYEPLRVSVSGSCCASCAATGTRCSGEPSGPILEPGKLYRVRLDVEPRYQDLVKKRRPSTSVVSPELFLSEIVGSLGTRMGFGPVLLATHDPTNPRVWHLLARWSLVPGRPADLPAVRCLSAEPVEEPPQARTDDTLDLGLTADEVWAVKHALLTDDDTRHLGGFASTFDDGSPIARDLLKMKAVLAAIRSTKDQAKREVRDLAPLLRVLQKATAPLGEDAARVWEKYRGLTVSSKDEGDIAEILSSLTQAVQTKGSRRPSPRPSPAALQLAFANRRPKLSLVEDDLVAQKRLAVLDRRAKSGDPAARRAQAKLQDANRLMERMQWISWYRRHSQVPLEQGPAPGSVTGRWSRDPDDSRVQGPERDR